MLAPSWVPLLQHAACGIQNLVLVALHPTLGHI